MASQGESVSVGSRNVAFTPERFDLEVLPDILPNVLFWSVHLARRNVSAIPTLIVVMLSAGLLVTILFHSALPGLAAILLLAGSVKDYLFPIHFKITAKGVESRSIGSRLELSWKDVRRCIIEKHQITLTSLSTPGRLDVFRGVTLKFAGEREPGDRATVLQACKQHKPDLIPDV